MGFKTDFHSLKLKLDKMRKPIVTHFFLRNKTGTENVIHLCFSTKQLAIHNILRMCTIKLNKTVLDNIESRIEMLK